MKFYIHAIAIFLFFICLFLTFKLSELSTLNTIDEQCMAKNEIVLHDVTFNCIPKDLWNKFTLKNQLIKLSNIY